MGTSKGVRSTSFVINSKKTPDLFQQTPNCPKCGNPVDGPYCRGCALLRKKFKEDLFTYCVENGIFQELQDTSESSDDNTNVVNAPQESFVVKQDPGNSQSPPHIDHCCYECGDSFDDIFCRRCTYPHETYQCQPMNEDYYHEQIFCYDYNSFGFDQFQPPQYTVNHPILNSQNELLNSQNKLMEQMTSICDMVGQIMQKKEEEKRIAEGQASKDRYWKIPICYDDDEDDTIAITPILPIEEPDNSLSMGDEHLDTIPATKSDEVIKSSVEDLVSIPSESAGVPKMCDVPLCENTTHLNALNDIL
ncbi:hypothetical protein Tco_0824238 [Tanacetum coccineum]|uniref:Uncharacterized protein n=1 Tax=Tanacetum coccineum TaxID=301880 RepID=A0ABQ5AQ72_9ASTR